MVSGLTFKSLIRLELIFVSGVKQRSDSILLHMDISSSTLLKDYTFFFELSQYAS